MIDAKHMTTCYVCGATVDTLEVSQGGSEDGCQLANDEWVCSRECWDAVAGPPAQEMIPKDVALAMVAAAYEAAAGRAEVWNVDITMENPVGDYLRALTPADAQAALYKVKREAQNEALREAAKRMKEKADIESEYSPFNAACFDVAERAIRKLMEDKNDE